ncbi:MAG: hypothetical protein BroJett030_13700 [Alphaproteobacteria bacterium]|nr:MAG: hypothetical protein BroJett030_13700 [Alphaproteobacteria bacterium]
MAQLSTMMTNVTYWSLMWRSALASCSGMNMAPAPGQAGRRAERAKAAKATAKETSRTGTP